MSDALKHGSRPVPFRRLVRTSPVGSGPKSVDHANEEEYGYGCVEWFQYPRQQDRSDRLTSRRRSLQR